MPCPPLCKLTQRHDTLALINPSLRPLLLAHVLAAAAAAAAGAPASLVAICSSVSPSDPALCSVAQLLLVEDLIERRRGAMRDLSCFGDSSVGVSAAASVSGCGALDRSLHAATTTVYSAALSSGKELLIRVTWTRSTAGAAGLAVAFDEGLSPSPSSRSTQHLLRKKRGSRSLVTDAGTAVGIHWDNTAAEYPSHSPTEPPGDYCLAIVADAELALLLGTGDAARDLSRRFATAPRPALSLVSRREQLRGAAATHTTRCRFREGGQEHEVAVHACRGGEGEVRVSIDGKRVAEVRRVGCGFRGNRAAVLADGEVVDVMWDVHDWWFGRGGAGAQFMVRARAEEGRLWMADQPPAAGRAQSPGGFFLHVQCYRR